MSTTQCGRCGDVTEDGRCLCTASMVTPRLLRVGRWLVNPAHIVSVETSSLVDDPQRAGKLLRVDIVTLSSGAKFYAACGALEPLVDESMGADLVEVSRG